MYTTINYKLSVFLLYWINISINHGYLKILARKCLSYIFYEGTRLAVFRDFSWFRTYSWQFLGNHMECWGLNLGWLHARLVLYLFSSAFALYIIRIIMSAKYHLSSVYSELFLSPDVYIEVFSGPYMTYPWFSTSTPKAAESLRNEISMYTAWKLFNIWIYKQSWN